MLVILDLCIKENNLEIRIDPDPDPQTTNVDPKHSALTLFSRKDLWLSKCKASRDYNCELFVDQQNLYNTHRLPNY
jgi:hypothetical protein